MTHAVDLSLAVATVSASLYIALGAWVLTLKPRRLQTTLLGLFAVAFGLITVPAALLFAFHLVQDLNLYRWIQAPFVLLAPGLALALAASVPKKLEDRRLLAPALGAGVFVGLTYVIYALVLYPSSGLLATPRSPVLVLRDVAEGAAFALLALRAAPSRDPSRTEVTQYAILAIAFVVLEGLQDGQVLVGTVAPLSLTDPVQAVLRAFMQVDEFLIAAALWGANAVQARDETVRAHWAPVLGILGLILAGAVYQVADPTATLTDNVMRGVMRTLGVGLLAYGVLRHDLAGLDEKVEFGLSKTTVAGVFVAVFFAASEAAQVLFADFAGNELIGVAAAALLVFAISPLQRLADRFAAKAVPGGAEAGADVEERYRREIEATLADGVITREEERHLARRADELGIGAERALELREQVEGERSNGADGDRP